MCEHFSFQPSRSAKLVSVLLLVAAAASAQTSVELLPPADGDLAAAQLVVPVAAKASLEVPRPAVAVSWPVSGDAALEPQPVPFVARSREYWVEVSAGELGRGVPVYAESPGALVRLNPAPGSPLSKAIDPLRLVVVDGGGRIWADGGAMEQLAGAEELGRAGVPFPAGTSAFRLRSDLGAGTFELAAEGATGGGRYVMHVLDAASDVELTLATGRSNYLHGQTLEIAASLVRGGARFVLKEIDGFVSSPAGRAWPVTFHRGRGGVYRAALELDALEAPAPGLWEVHVSAQGRVEGRPVLRGARTAFACAVPSARLSGDVELGAGVVRIGVEVAAAGRYEVRGVIYGTGPDGELTPAGVAQSAAWLAPGTGVLALELEPEAFASRGFAAPFEVRDLRLDDQGRMAVLHRQARGLKIE